MSDDLLDEVEGATDAEPLGPLPESAAICDHVEADGSICGAGPFVKADGTPDPNRLRMHKSGKHRDRSQDRKPAAGAITGRPKRKDTRPSHKDRKPTQAKTAAATASGPNTNRAETYTQSLALIALGAHLAIPAFDQYDLDVVNKGAPNLGSALDQVGAQNETIRKTMDLILGGGSGGAYLSLLMAASAIAMPILAHHDLIPASTGQRFGMMSGVSVPSAPVPASDEPHPSVQTERTGDPDDPANWDADRLYRFMTRIPETVMVDLAGKMMRGEPATVVTVPTMPTDQHEQPNPFGVNRGDDAGSEQPAPEPVPVPS